MLAILRLHVGQDGARLIPKTGLPVAQGSCSWANTSPLPSLTVAAPRPPTATPTLLPQDAVTTRLPLRNALPWWSSCRRRRPYRPRKRPARWRGRPPVAVAQGRPCWGRTKDNFFFNKRSTNQTDLRCWDLLSFTLTRTRSRKNFKGNKHVLYYS